jgi:hypothetical protein
MWVQRCAKAVITVTLDLECSLLDLLCFTDTLVVYAEDMRLDVVRKVNIRTAVIGSDAV